MKNVINVIGSLLVLSLSVIYMFKSYTAIGNEGLILFGIGLLIYMTWGNHLDITKKQDEND